MITKYLLPVTGYGTRFLHATKSQSEEMLPILSKPLTQYGVEDASLILHSRASHGGLARHRHISIAILERWNGLRERTVDVYCKRYLTNFMICRRLPEIEAIFHKNPNCVF